MRRPSAAREALSLSLLVKTSWADASRVERVPLEAAGAKPFVLLTRRPTAERATDTWRLRFAGLLLFFKFVIWGNENGR